MEETPTVWVLKRKQTLMSHLSLGFASLLLPEQFYFSDSEGCLAWQPHMSGLS